MLTKRNEIQDEIILSTLDELVPKNHLVRQLDKIDYSFIYEEVKSLYSEDGRPSIDPVILFKILLIKDVFGLKSMLQTIKEIEVNLAYRWFLNIPLSKKIPHYSVISNNFNNRINKPVFNKIYKRIITEALNYHISITDIEIKNLKFKLRRNRMTNQISVETDELSLYEQTLV